MSKTMNQASAIKLLEQHGWTRAVGGKHQVKMTKSGNRPIPLPDNKRRDYPAALQNAKLKQAGITKEGRYAMNENAYTVEIHDEDGSLWGQVVEEPGCFGTGDTMEELAESIGEALALAGALHPRFEGSANLVEGESVERRLTLC